MSYNESGVGKRSYPTKSNNEEGGRGDGCKYTTSNFISL